MTRSALGPEDKRQRRCQRQREYRARDKTGSRWASAFVPHDLVEKLIDAGLISEPEATDKRNLGAALVAAARRWSISVTAYATAHETVIEIATWQLETMGPADRHMNFRKGLSGPDRYMAQSRRRDPLLATLAFPGCHTLIRRPALGAAGRGDSR